MYAFFAGSTQNVRNLTNSRNLKIVSCRSSNTPSLQKMKPLDKIIVISKVFYKLVKRKKWISPRSNDSQTVASAL